MGLCVCKCNYWHIIVSFFMTGYSAVINHLKWKVMDNKFSARKCWNKLMNRILIRLLNLPSNHSSLGLQRVHWIRCTRSGREIDSLDLVPFFLLSWVTSKNQTCDSLMLRQKKSIIITLIIKNALENCTYCGQCFMSNAWIFTAISTHRSWQHVHRQSGKYKARICNTARHTFTWFHLKMCVRYCIPQVWCTDCPLAGVAQRKLHTQCHGQVHNKLHLHARFQTESVCLEQH